MKTVVFSKNKELKKQIKILLRNEAIKLGKVFNFNISKVNVIVVDSKKEFEEFVGRKPYRWEVAVHKNVIIIIFDPDKLFLKQYNGSNFSKILAHEFVHLFYFHIIPIGVPYWLNEGLAYYLAEQSFTRLKYRGAKMRALNYFDKFDEKIYKYGPNLVSVLIEEYGLAEFIRRLKRFANTEKNKDDVLRCFLESE